MQPQFNEGIVVLENRRLVNSGSGTPDFPRRKSGVRVSSAPPLDLAIEELSVRELLEALLNDKAKRRLSLKRKTNSELFTLYYDHLKVTLLLDKYQLIIRKGGYKLRLSARAAFPHLFSI